MKFLRNNCFIIVRVVVSAGSSSVARGWGPDRAFNAVRATGRCHHAGGERAWPKRMGGGGDPACTRVVEARNGFAGGRGLRGGASWDLDELWRAFRTDLSHSMICRKIRGNVSTVKAGPEPRRFAPDLAQRLDAFFERYADPEDNVWKGGGSKAKRPTE